MKVSAIISLFAALASAKTGACVEFEDCSVNGEIFSLKINNCTSAPCKLEIGSTADMTVEFRSKIPAHSLTERAYFMISDVEQEAMVQPNACNALKGGTCPLQEGVSALYKAQVTINQDCPPIKSNLVWMLKNEQPYIIVCLAVEVRLGYNSQFVDERASEQENVEAAAAEKTGTDTFEKVHGHPRQGTFRGNQA